jgi:hypothetical protein
MDDAIRIVYLARRNPELDHDVWVREWRSHWALAARQAESSTVRRYLQCEVLFDAHERPRDGLGISEYASEADRARNRSASGYHAIMQADELRVFDRRVEEVAVFMRQRVLAGSGLGPFKLVRFVRRNPRVVAEDFAEVWAGEHARRVIALRDDLLGYAQSTRVPPRIPASRLEVDGLEEFWFADARAARALLDSAALERTTHEVGVVHVTDHLVTDEVVLKDERG